jgi:hypothetical protein
MRIGVNGTHVQSGGCRVGHELQLVALTNELRMRSDSSYQVSPYNRVFYVCGPAGSGMRTFVTRLWENLSGRETPRILFRIDPRSGLPLDEQLKKSVEASKSQYHSMLEDLSMEIDRQTARYETKGKKLPNIGKLALWAARIQQRIVDNPDIKALQLIFALHDYANLPELHRKVLSRAIPRSTDNIDVRIIITGQDEDALTEIDALFFDRAPASRIDLPPVTLNEVLKWLYAKDIPTEFADAILERAHGLPGLLDSACEEVQNERGDLLLVRIAENALGGICGELRKYICMAALLPEINRDSLRAIMPEIRVQECMNVLKICDWSDCWWKNESFVFGSRVGKALCTYLENNHKPTFDDTSIVAGQLATICAAIPAYEDRLLLTRLLAFHYFNRHALLAIMPEDVERTFAFAMRHLDDYFERSGENLRMRPGTRQLVEQYAVLTRQPNDNVTRFNIQKLWETRRKALSDDIAHCEDKLDKDTAALFSVRKHLSELDKNHAAKRDARPRSFNQPTTEDQEAAGTGKTKTAGLFLQAAGTCVLYLCLLSSSRAAILYALLGLGLIVSGLFSYQSPTGRSNVAKPENKEDSQEQARDEDARSELRCELEMKEDWIASKIAEGKREKRSLIRQMDEAYPATLMKRL